MFNLIRKDFSLLFSSKSSIFTFLVFIPLYRLVLGMNPSYSIVFLSIVTLGYLLTVVSFAFEIKNKPYIVISSLPTKKRDIVISKYIELFINYTIAVIYTFIYSKFLSLFGVNISGIFDISTLKYAFLVLALGLSISLPLQFSLPQKIANFINIFFYISFFNYFFSTGGENLFKNLNGINQFILTAIIFLTSMGLSLLLYRHRDLS